jgi:hypothetical protein
MKSKNKNNNTTLGIFPKFNRKMVERGKIDTPTTQIHDYGTGTSVKSGRVKLV